MIAEAEADLDEAGAGSDTDMDVQDFPLPSFTEEEERDLEADNGGACIHSLKKRRETWKLQWGSLSIHSLKKKRGHLEEAMEELESTPTTRGTSRCRMTNTTGSTKVTARKSSKKMQQGRIKVGKRVKITKGSMYHLLEQQPIAQGRLAGLPANFIFYGTVTSAVGQQRYNVSFDLFPQEDKVAKGLKCQNLFVLPEDADEPRYDHVAEECAEITRKKKTLSPAEESSQEFVSLGHDVIKGATRFVHKYGREEGEHVEWSILKDNENVVDDPLIFEDRVQYKKDIPWSERREDNCYNSLFFEHFFPSIEGHAKKIDDWLSNPKCPLYQTAKQHKIVFHDEASELGPNWKVRVCYTLLIAAASESHNGLENLWKRGRSGCRHDYPDYGQYMQLEHFRAFQAACPYCWCSKHHWYKPADESPWQTLTPLLDGFNEKCREMIKCVLLMLDESMSGWHPKTSRLGGLPNITF